MDLSNRGHELRHRRQQRPRRDDPAELLRHHGELRRTRARRRRAPLAIASPGQSSETIVFQRSATPDRSPVSTSDAARDDDRPLAVEHGAHRGAQLVLVGGEVELHQRFTNTASARRSSFSIGGQRQRVDHDDVLGQLVAPPAARRRTHAARRAAGAGTRRGPRRRRRRPRPSRRRPRGDRRPTATRGVLGEHGFDLHRVHVVAAAHVHLLVAADEAQPPGIVDPPEVARAHEAVGRERGRRQRRRRPSSPTSRRGSGGTPRRRRRPASQQLGARRRRGAGRPTPRRPRRDR